MNIELKPIPCSRETMEYLEGRGIIRILSPGRHTIEVKKGMSKHKSIYEAGEKFGPHKLICVTINSTVPENFLYHNDDEDFMLIDKLGSEDLILTISLLCKDEINKKIESETLSNLDFISIICNKNDPYTSFFTMCKHFPHVETVLRESDTPPSFYVSESRDLDEVFIDLKNYNLVIMK